ncbi:MAG: hypothetical protein OXU20_22150 [Myxococcales bacterium]|nr:hypothetical protein [Myxococcales bacterium]MDD9968100.1 hypothetical protein [Myxococcales bacterium]
MARVSPWILVLGLWLGACAQPAQPAPGPSAPGQEPASGAAAAAWLDRVEAAHERVNAALARSDLAEARGVLTAALSAAAPERVDAYHTRAVRQDLCFRLARVELAAEQPAAALEVAQRGLALGQGQDVLTTNLWLAAGLAHEALGADGEAADAYHRALVLQERLLTQVLAGAQDAGTP